MALAQNCFKKFNTLIISLIFMLFVINVYFLYSKYIENYENNYSKLVCSFKYIKLIKMEFLSVKLFLSNL